MEAPVDDTTEIDDDGDHIYCRTLSRARIALENQLLAYYGVTSETHVAFVFPSGMSAISTIIECFAKPDQAIAIGDELYCDTPKVVERLVKHHRALECVRLSALSEQHPVISLIFTETASNPTGSPPDYDALFGVSNRPCDRPDLPVLPVPVVCFDNTWLSGCSFNPFEEFGDRVDVVVESASKYARDPFGRLG